MRIIVFGGPGGVAREVVAQALGHGHDVTLFSRSGRVGSRSGRARDIAGDVFDFDQVGSAIEQQDAVVSTIAADARNGSAAAAVANIIHAMAVNEVRKLAVVSAAGTFRRDDPSLPLMTRLMASSLSKSRYDDLENMEQRVKASDLIWTIARATSLTDSPATGAYRFTVDGSIPRKAAPIPRADVAAALLKALETSLWDRRVVTVTG